MNITQTQSATPNRLLFWGVLLFLAGLLIGLAIPLAANPRMGLSAHLEGTLNGMFLVLLGLIWPRIRLSAALLRSSYFLALYGSFANFVAVGLAAFTGAGKMMPLAGGKESSGWEEPLISFLLVTLALAMVSLCVLVLVGLYRNLRTVAN